MRTFLALIAAFTIGAMTVEIHNLREMAELQWDIGYEVGARENELLPGWHIEKDDDSYIEEDEVGWDCETMGNRKCGTF